jgi:single-stranded-DNA-specific exonuclease
MSIVWQERKSDAEIAASLSVFAECPIVAKILSSRGIDAATEEEFFDPVLKRLVEPSKLPGVDKAVDVILPFVSSGKKIVVFGDYDVDGVAASAIMVKVLKKMGADADAFLPDRFEEGYGMTQKSIDRMLSEHEGVSLIITVDNGISSAEEVKLLRERGITVVVTDHHLPGVILPEADALINPRVSSFKGCEDLSGAGVAFFLANALVKKAVSENIYSGPKLGAPLLVLAGVATVADMMPLVGQNRIIVSSALKYFIMHSPIGMRELFDRAERKAVNLTARDFSFALAPRINASGRIASAREAYDLLMTEDREEARHLAIKVDGRNVERKNHESRMFEEAMAQAGAFEDMAAVVVSDSKCDSRWHSGVSGIVASRILEKMRKPVAVITDGRGSVRAPSGYNVHAALEYSSCVLERFGGHAAAGGFSVQDGKLEEFIKLFNESCLKQRIEGEVENIIEFDSWLEPTDITMTLFEKVSAIAPFGEGNPEPVFGLKKVHFSDIKPIGIEGKHLSITFANRCIPRAVWWGNGEKIEDLRKHSNSAYDILFTLVVSYHYGETSLELRIIDVAENKMQ